MVRAAIDPDELPDWAERTLGKVQVLQGLSENKIKPQQVLFALSAENVKKLQM